MIRCTGLILGLALLLLAIAGCATVAKQSPTMKAAKANFTVDAETLRIRMRSLAGPFGGFIEESGDEIMNASDDPWVLQEALIWKADGLPAIRATLFRPDPLVALLDTWAFLEQLIDYFESGAGRERLGDSADLALNTTYRMRAEVREIMEWVVGPETLKVPEQFVGEWAAEHPIVESIAGRESIMREVGHFKTKSGTSGFKLVGNLAVTMDDMLKQIEAYTANIPKQARWEAQLAAMELAGPDNLMRSRELLPVMLDAAESLAGDVDNLPALVAHERQAVLDALRRERIESLVFLRQERLETLDQISAERAAVLEGADQIRADTTESIHAEVVLISELVRQQREQTMIEADTIVGRNLDDAFERAAGLVDQIFLRTAILLVLIFIGLVLLLLLTWRLFRTRPATT